MLVNKFSNGSVSGEVHCESGVFTVKGRLSSSLVNRATLHYRAAEPQDLRMSVSGSGLPFPNPEMAFGSVNSGQANVSSFGNFEFQVFSPNAYYATHDESHHIGQGKILVTPEVLLTVLRNDGFRSNTVVKLPGASSHLRTLTTAPGKRARSTGRNDPTVFA